MKRVNVRYRSPRYAPELVVNRYLYIEINTGVPIVVETDGGKHNFTICSYELPKSERAKYSNAIAAAEEIKTNFPYMVEFTENGSEQRSG